MFQGVNFFNLSMPVEIFDTCSFLQVIASWYSGVPATMRKLIQIEDKYE